MRRPGTRDNTWGEKGCDGRVPHDATTVRHGGYWKLLWLRQALGERGCNIDMRGWKRHGQLGLIVIQAPLAEAQNRGRLAASTPQLTSSNAATRVLGEVGWAINPVECATLFDMPVWATI